MWIVNKDFNALQYTERPVFCSTGTPLCKRPSGIYIRTRFSEKNFTGWANFPPGCTFLSGRCFAFLKHTQKSHKEDKTGRVKYKNFTRYRVGLIFTG